MIVVDINNKKTSIDHSKLSDRVKEIIAICETIPDGEGWDKRRLSEVMKCGLRPIEKTASHPYLSKYRIIKVRTIYWVNSKTYAAETRKASK